MTISPNMPGRIDRFHFCSGDLPVVKLILVTFSTSTAGCSKELYEWQIDM